VSKSKRRREANPVRVRKMEAQSNSSSSSVRSPGAVRNKMEKREKNLGKESVQFGGLPDLARNVLPPSGPRFLERPTLCLSFVCPRLLTGHHCTPCPTLVVDLWHRPSSTFGKNFYRLPFTPPLSGRLIAPSIAYRN
jgi:hypothetical protein